MTEMKPDRFVARRQRGSAVVEMAIIAPVALLLLIAIMEFSLIFFGTLTMQYAVREGVRYGITGRVDADPATANQQRYLAVIQAIKNNSMGMYDSFKPVISVNGTKYATSNAYSASMFGGPEDIVVLRIDCTWNVVTPLISALFTKGQYQFSVAATMRNEAFSATTP
jgi:Flp pilus assembly protein TadG